MPKRLRDVDAAERMYRLQALVWGVYAGVLGGVPVGAGVAHLAGGNLIIGALTELGVMVVGVPLVAGFVTQRAGATAQAIYNPSGDSTPYRRQYSYADALVMRGRYADAAAAYEAYCLEYPDDPEPYLRLARLYRDKLKQYQDAIAWFRRSRADARLTPGQELVVIQEIVEIHLHKLRAPQQAIPELALLCRKFPGTPAAEAAERELAELRQMLVREREKEIPLGGNPEGEPD